MRTTNKSFESIIICECVRRSALNDGALAVLRLDILKHNTYFAKLIKFKCHIKREVRKAKTEASLLVGNKQGN